MSFTNDKILPFAQYMLLFELFFVIQKSHRLTPKVHNTLPGHTLVLVLSLKCCVSFHKIIKTKGHHMYVPETETVA